MVYTPVYLRSWSHSKFNYFGSAVIHYIRLLPVLEVGFPAPSVLSPVGVDLLLPFVQDKRGCSIW
jgi:hypothetical protein